nr:albumin {N-terminal} [Macaca fascicularis=cynomolgus monkeys, retina, Peptide Partial, 20 aa] [Macaca fascicularis]
FKDLGEEHFKDTHKSEVAHR